MSDKNTGGPAFPTCSRCEDSAVRKQGHQWLCAKHYRFGQMRATAKRHGKSVPSNEALHMMRGADLTCPDCGRRMNWLAADGADSVASLQHYRDGSMAIVCLSCNTRHASMEGDSFRDMDTSSKQCPRCGQIKQATEFTSDNSRSGALRRKSLCRDCSNSSINEWRGKNREKYNEYQRDYRAKRKAEGNPVHGGA